MELENKKARIAFYKKNILPNLNGLYSKVHSLFYSLDKADSDCIILDDDYSHEFDSLMLELEIILSDISKCDFSLDMLLSNTQNLLGNNYNNKLNELKPKLTAINTNLHSWKTNVSQWMLPLFFNILMKLDTESILNDKSNTKETINNAIMNQLQDKLDKDNVSYTVDNDTIIVNNSNINISSSSNLVISELVPSELVPTELTPSELVTSELSINTSNLGIDYCVLDDLD
jgi:hypothetical protein